MNCLRCGREMRGNICSHCGYAMRDGNSAVSLFELNIGEINAELQTNRRVAVVCAVCGAALPDGARFCPACGAATVISSHPAPQEEEDRRKREDETRWKQEEEKKREEEIRRQAEEKAQRDELTARISTEARRKQEEKRNKKRRTVVIVTIACIIVDAIAGAITGKYSYGSNGVVICAVIGAIIGVVIVLIHYSYYYIINGSHGYDSVVKCFNDFELMFGMVVGSVIGSCIGSRVGFNSFSTGDIGIAIISILLGCGVGVLSKVLLKLASDY